MDFYHRYENASRNLLAEMGELPRRTCILARSLENAFDFTGYHEISYSSLNGFGDIDLAAGGVYRNETRVVATAPLFYGKSPVDTRHSALDIRLLNLAGVREFILLSKGKHLNGGGSIVWAADHVNISGLNPLVGANVDAFGERFPDMSDVYDPELRKEALKISYDLGAPAEEGIWVCAETADLTDGVKKALSVLGARAMAPDGVAEPLAAAHCGCMIAVGIFTEEKIAQSSLISSIIESFSKR